MTAPRRNAPGPTTAHVPRRQPPPCPRLESITQSSFFHDALKRLPVFIEEHLQHFATPETCA